MLYYGYMNERIHFPPHHDEIPKRAPLIFLAGPIQGSPDWQTETALELTHHLKDAHVASPRRITEDKNFDYKEQVRWEKDHLRRARNLGVIMFWFAAQDHALEYEKGRAYSQTTRIEMGKVIGWREFTQFPIVIGFDPEYTPQGGGSERYMRDDAEENNIPVYDSLDDTIDATMRSFYSLKD